MAETLTSRINISIAGTLANAIDLSTPVDDFVKTIALTWANGTGADQANRLFHDTRTLSTGANEDLDLVGSLTDGLGQTFSPARFKLLLIYNKPANTTNLTIKPGAANGIASPFGAAAHAVTIPPGGIFLVAAPAAAAFALTAGTGDLLNIANSAGASADYDIVVIGASA